MRINVYPRVLLEQMWQEDKKLFTPEAENPPLCLRCGQPLHSRLIVNALSRHADAHICEDCGIDEALRDACDLVLPLQEWYAIKKERKVEVPQTILSASWPIPAPTMTDADGGRHGFTAAGSGQRLSWGRKLTSSVRPCSCFQSLEIWVQ